MRFQHEAQWVTLLLCTCVLQGLTLRVSVWDVVCQVCCWQWGSGCQGEVPQPQKSACRHLGLRNSVCCIHRHKRGIKSLCSWSATAVFIGADCEKVSNQVWDLKLLRTLLFVSANFLSALPSPPLYIRHGSRQTGDGSRQDRLFIQFCVLIG